MLLSQQFSILCRSSTKTKLPSPSPLRIPHPPIDLPQIHPIHLALRNLAHHSRRASRHNTKTRNHHIWRHDTAIQDPHIVLNDRELADHDVGPDIDVRADERGFDDGGGSDEDVVGDFEGVVGELPAYRLSTQLILPLNSLREMRTLYTASQAASTHTHG
jgi:hypothetical protein